MNDTEAEGGHSPANAFSTAVPAASSAAAASEIAGRAGSGRKRKPSAIMQESLEEKGMSSSDRRLLESHARSQKLEKQAAARAAKERARALRAHAEQQPAGDGPDEGYLPFATDGSEQQPMQALPIHGASAIVATELADAAVPAKAVPATPRSTAPVPHALILYTDVTAQSCCAYLVAHSSIGSDDAALLLALHGCGATRNGMAQLALERFLKRSGVRAALGGPLYFGKEFSMHDTSASTASTSGLAAGPYAGLGVGDSLNVGDESSRKKRRMGKGFHNMWIDKSIVCLYDISFVADDRPLGVDMMSMGGGARGKHHASAVAAAASAAAAASPAAAAHYHSYAAYAPSMPSADLPSPAHSASAAAAASPAAAAAAAAHSPSRPEMLPPNLVQAAYALAHSGSTQRQHAAPASAAYSASLLGQDSPTPDASATQHAQRATQHIASHGDDSARSQH